MEPPGPSRWSATATGKNVSYTAPLHALRGTDEPRYGGKSASLGELLAAAIPVPPGFAISAEAYRACVTSESPDAESIRAAEIPSQIRDEIAAAYRELAHDAVAVRSSAIGEDSKEATFAGQQQTFLWVRDAERVVERVRDCWASLFSAEAVSYRANFGRADEPPAMGVAVQAMIDAEVSGVMFTCSPTSGDPSVIAVNASWGLGEAVVSGEVTPDELLVSKVTGEIVRERIGDKHLEHVLAPDGGTATREIDDERRSKRCVTDEQLHQLISLGKRIERHFESAQDVEWAISREGELYVLQSRPVTTAKRTKPQPEATDAMSLVMKQFGAR
jgi:pyruvate,water dikinase